MNWSFYLTIGMFIVALISVILLFIGWLNRQKEKSFENGIQKGQALIEQPNFLGVDEVIIPRHTIIQEKGNMISKSNNYIKIVAVSGVTWMPYILNAMLDKKVKIQLLLVDPKGSILNYLADNEPKLSKHASPLGISVEESEIAIHGTIEVYKDIAEIRLYNTYPLWRGIIVDGKASLYSILHYPREGWEPPTIKTKNSIVIKHFEEYYFDKMWNAARSFTNGV